MNLVRRDRSSTFEEVSTHVNPFIAIVGDDIALAARLHVRVLVTVENRDERSMCARFIHHNSAYREGPFVTFFGNGVGGDAGRLRHLIEQARGGTLFIDDIATLTADVQAQFLSLLDGVPHFSAVHRARPAVRIIAGASRHVDPERAPWFCEQLFYRLNIIHIDGTACLLPRGRECQATAGR